MIKPGPILYSDQFALQKFSQRTLAAPLHQARPPSPSISAVGCHIQLWILKFSRVYSTACSVVSNLVPGWVFGSRLAYSTRISAPQLLLEIPLPVIYLSPVRWIPLLRSFVWSRFWLLPPGLGLADSLPLVIKSLQSLCRSIPADSLLPHFGLCCFQDQPQSRTGLAHQLDLHAVWPVQRQSSAPTPGRLLLSVNRAKFCPILPRSTTLCT
jgi:hypothetical protein